MLVREPGRTLRQHGLSLEHAIFLIGSLDDGFDMLIENVWNLSIIGDRERLDSVSDLEIHRPTDTIDFNRGFNDVAADPHKLTINGIGTSVQLADRIEERSGCALSTGIHQVADGTDQHRGSDRNFRIEPRSFSGHPSSSINGGFSPIVRSPEQ